jgi:large subunit ribosomal protein L4
MRADIYNTDGKKTGTVELPDRVFNASWSADLVHDVVVAMQGNKRFNIAHAKDRSEVRGGGRKPWRQKGTGRARHGSIRSPIWRGGGATFGPRSERDFSKKINKKARAASLAMILSRKLKEKEILFVDSVSLDAVKTAEAKKMLASLSKAEDFGSLVEKKKNVAYIATVGKDENVIKSFQNMGNVVVDEVRNVNSLDLLTYKYLIISNPAESVEVLAKRVGEKVASAEDENIKTVRTAKKAVAKKPAAKIVRKKAVRK